MSLREQRKALGLSQARLAAAAGVSPALVAMAELGQRRPSPKTQEQLERALAKVEWERERNRLAQDAGERLIDAGLIRMGGA